MLLRQINIHWKCKIKIYEEEINSYIKIGNIFFSLESTITEDNCLSIPRKNSKMNYKKTLYKLVFPKKKIFNQKHVSTVVKETFAKIFIWNYMHAKTEIILNRGFEEEDRQDPKNSNLNILDTVSESKNFIKVKINQEE